MATIGIEDKNPNRQTGFTRIALYDMSIEDVKKRREERLIFPTIQAAIKFLGDIGANALRARLVPGKYVNDRAGKKYAVRVISDKEFNRLKRA